MLRRRGSAAHRSILASMPTAISGPRRSPQDGVAGWCFEHNAGAPVANENCTDEWWLMMLSVLELR